MEERIAGRLVERGHTFGTTIPLTQDDLAELAGTQRATNSVLRGFERRGLVALHRARITVLDPPALARRAGRGLSALEPKPQQPGAGQNGGGSSSGPSPGGGEDTDGGPSASAGGGAGGSGR